MDRSRVVLSPSRKRAVPTACQRCHSRKVKCSGGQPCDGCRRANKSPECTYPQRTRLIKVDQDYLEKLVQENRQLRSSQGTPRDNHQIPPAMSPASDSSLPGPSIEQAPWFQKFNIPHTPILIGEASDAGFATRFRQSISGTQHNHLPRLNYPSDDRLLALSEQECPWPTASKARTLVNVALRYASGQYHIVRKSQILRSLEEAFQNPNATSSLVRSKFWALFAIGELYSVRVVNKGSDYPGMLYFAKATKAVYIVGERPQFDSIELRLLLAFYSLSINRRHAAYAFAGSSVRHAVVIGLHLNVPDSQLSDAAVREHRNRLWWTAYIFDRMCALNLGNPVSVQDDVIDVNLPSELDLPEADDFTDADYYTARIRLAQLSGRIVQSIYVRKSHPSPHEAMLAQRVQVCLKDLHEWGENLPAHLRLEPGDTASLKSTTVSLHLSFNQCVIVATRLILLHILRARVTSWRKSVPEPQFPHSAVTLAEACSRCARHSVRLLTDGWVDGSFPMLDCFCAQYLFSATTILTISNLMISNERRGEDIEQIDAALDILSQLRASGQLSAKEFCQHFEAIKLATNDLPEERRIFGAPDIQQPAPARTDTNQDVTPDPSGLSMPGPTLQELLMQPSLDLHFIDDTLYQDVSQGLYWSNFTPDHVAEDSWGPV